MTPRSRPLATASALLALAVSAARAAGLDPAMRERLAAIKNEGEGSVVTEDLLRRHDSSSPAARAREDALRAFGDAGVPAQFQDWAALAGSGR